MKLIKTFVAGALTAFLAMAFMGTSSVMGETTKLCQADSSCTEVTHLHMTTLNGIRAKILGGFITVECEVLFLGDSLGGGIYHGRYTFIGCMGSCTVTETSGQSIINMLKEGHETAKATFEGEIFVECGGSSLECAYDFENLVGTGKGPLLSSETNGSVSIIGQTLHIVSGGGFLCPKEAKLDITLTPLSATYISS